MKERIVRETDKAQVAWLIFAVVLSFAGCALCAKIFFQAKHYSAVMLGWLLALVFNFSGLLIKLRAMKQDTKKFFLYAFIAAPLNTFLFLGVACYLLSRLGMNQRPFIIAVFISYGILLIYDMLLLHRISVTKNNSELSHA